MRAFAAVMCALGVALAFPQSGQTQTRNAQGDFAGLPIANPTPEAVALARQYLDLLDMPQRLGNMIQSMLPAMFAGQDQVSGERTPKEVQDMTVAVGRESVTALTPALITRASEVYAHVYTEDELRALVTFYGSPVGESVTLKSNLSQVAMSDAMNSIGPDLVADMIYRMCKRIECPPEMARQGKLYGK